MKIAIHGMTHARARTRTDNTAELAHLYKEKGGFSET